VRDELDRDLYVKRAAEVLKVDEKLLRRRAEKGAGEEAEAGPAAEGPRDPLELALVRRLVHEPANRERFRAASGEKWFDDEVLRNAALFTASRAEGMMSFPVDQAPAGLRNLLTGLVMEDVPGDYAQIAAALEKRRLKRMSEELSARMREAEAQGNWEEFSRLAKEKSRIDRS
jgi:hypothetical protein